MAKHTAVPETPRRTKDAWKRRNDSGPHDAHLPSGQDVTFNVPDSNALIAARKLPEELTEIALFAASYPDGVEGYVNDLSVRSAMASPENAAEAAERLGKAVTDSIELGRWLVAHMLVEPSIKPADVPDLPQMDVRMLLEFAERKRNVDHRGVKLPIALLAEYERFLHEPGRAPADGDGAGVDPGVPEPDRGADEG